MAESEEIKAWVAGRVTQDWFEGAPEVTVDRDEILVVGALKAVKVEGGDDAQKAAAAGRIKQYREDTREKRMAISNEAERRFERPISRGGKYGDKTLLVTPQYVPLLTPLRPKERMVLDSLVGARAARSPYEATARGIPLGGQHAN